MSSERDGLLERLDTVERRLAHHAAAEMAGLTDADAETGERWEAGQVWAHLAEFPAYWLEQVAGVLDHSRRGEAGPITFGRTRSDPGRIAAIERDRALPPETLLRRVRDGVARARDAIRSLPAEAWETVARHPTRGELKVGAILRHFVVEHLEEHAAQLDSLRAPRRG